jgi:nitrite reductase/ring-hydroxylating ferredoxin subunit
MEQQIIRLDEVPETGAVRADFFGRDVLVTRVSGRPRAYLDVCPHFGGPLELQGDGFVCGWHQAEFGLDGRCRRGPARADSGCPRGRGARRRAAAARRVTVGLARPAGVPDDLLAERRTGAGNR